MMFCKNHPSYCRKKFYEKGPWADVKHFTAVIYCHSTVLPSFSVKKQHYQDNYCRMAINYHSKKSYNIGPSYQTETSIVNYRVILTL
jgi:hypothetical protein